MKEIQLTQGQAALVDDEDFERVNAYRWYASFNPGYANGGRFLATRRGNKSDDTFVVFLHRFIMNAQKGQIVDHIDGDTLNNQRNNLRFATRSNNGCNNAHVLQKHNTSGLRGVSFNIGVGKWRAATKICGKSVHLGYFTDKLEAAKAYNEAAKKYHGDFATLNPIEGE